MIRHAASAAAPVACGGVADRAGAVRAQKRVELLRLLIIHFDRFNMRKDERADPG